MPISFHEDDDIRELGAAAFLKITQVEGLPGLAGALFLVNGRGEPLEFAYNRIELPESALWRHADLRRAAERKLAASLLGICAGTPLLMLCLANEVASELFCQDIRVAVPVARIGHASVPSSYAGVETQEALDHPQQLHLFWFPSPPEAGSVERRLMDRLAGYGLLLEPFERAARGLLEAYSTVPGAAS